MTVSKTTTSSSSFPGASVATLQAIAADAAAAASPPTAPLNSISSICSLSLSKPELSKETKFEEFISTWVSLRRRGDEHAIGSRMLVAGSEKNDDAVEVLRRLKTAPCLDSSDAGVVSKSDDA